MWAGKYLSRASMDRLNLLRRYQMSADIRKVAPGVSNRYLALMMEGLLKIKVGKDAEKEFEKLSALRREPFYSMGRIPLEVLKIEKRIDGMGRGNLGKISAEEKRLGGYAKRLHDFKELIRKSPGGITVANQQRTQRGLMEDADRIGAHVGAVRNDIKRLRREMA